MTDAQHKEFTERGAMFRKYAIGNHHLVYKGTMHFTSGWWTVLSVIAVTMVTFIFRPVGTQMEG